MPAPSFLAGLPKPLLFGLYGALGGLLGALLLGEPAWRLLKPPEADALQPVVAVGASASVKVYPGTKSAFIVVAARDGFDGPVLVHFDKLPPGISLPPVTLMKGEKEIEATVSIDDNVPPGTTKVSITGEAQDGKLKAPPASIDIEVIAPPASLALAVSPNLVVYTKGEGKFMASIARRGYDGEVSIRIDGLPEGITAAPAVIPRGGSEIEVTLKATEAAPARATKLTVIAEAATAGLKSTAPTQIDVKTPPIAPVDVVFVLDVTASMQWALNDLKNGIGKFADALSKAQLNFRLGLVTFQDITYAGEKVEVIQFEGAPFTSNAVIFRDKVGVLKAEGGGDIPESSLEGVVEAVKLPFRQGASKMLLLITDAPPKVVPSSNTASAVKAVADMVKDKGIDSVNVVVDQLDKDTYQPLKDAGTVKGGGKYFDIRDLVRDEGGFDSLLDTFGRDVTATAMARSSESKPQVAPLPPPPKVGETVALKHAEKPPELSIKGVQASGKFKAGTEKELTVAIGVWSGAIAAMLCLALLSGQYHYLRGQFPPLLRALIGFVGGLLVGTIGGAAGQGLFLVAQISAFRILGWMLLGGLAGTGLALFIPNLKWVYGLAGGALGGAAGGLGYMIVEPLANEIVGRLVGGLVVGFCIGLMVAIVEAAFRRAWLEVRYGRETITVNLGPEPVKVGGDAKICTVWARGAAPLALRFFIRDGRVICDDAVMKRESSVADGYVKDVGNVTVTVRMGSGSTSPPPQPREPAHLPTPPNASPAAAAKTVMLDDDFDGLPMAKVPPSSKPSSPVVPVSASRPASPSTPVSPPASNAPRPPVPAPMPTNSKPSITSRPPAPPGSGMAKPSIPSPATVAPKAASPSAPPPPASTTKHPDACPGCGRVNAGKPKTRYCMVCDQTY